MSNSSARVIEPDPAWRTEGAILQGHGTQQFMPTELMKVGFSGLLQGNIEHFTYLHGQ